jgi:L-ascorbate metabolism protein UlaG (beta-lactamase superfamily)
MDRLKLIIAVSDVILNKYGKNPKRKQLLTKKYGAKDAQEIQNEVNVCVSNKAEYKYLAVASIAGHYGAGKTRRKALGLKWQKTQFRIDYIYSMRGRSLESVAKLVIGGMFDKDSARELLLKFCGYNPEAVQAAVNYILNTKSNAKFCVYPIWFFQGNESLYGDCTAVLQYAEDGSVKHCILIDTAMAAASDTVIRKLKAAGVEKIDAVVISHAHGDHYGGLSKIMKALPVGRLYLPDCTQLDKYQKSYGNAIRRQAKKIQNHVYLKQGSSFAVGDINCKCIYQAPADQLTKHDSHYFVNNQSIVLRFGLGGIIYHTAGDLQNEGNNLMIKAVKNLKADIFKAQWHGDANACNVAICEAVRPGYSTSDYHNDPDRSGRGTTRKRLLAVGSKFHDNYTYGDIFYNIADSKITVKTSK